MAPLDDELRTVLSGRADLVSPAADPFEGIERRARGIRRRRGLAAVLGTTAAVAAIALAVPAVLGGSVPARDANTATTPSPTGPVVLHDARPANAVLWQAPPLGDEDLDAAVRVAYAAQTGDDPARVRGDQLWIGATPDGKLSLGWYQLWSEKVPEAVLLLAAAEPGGPARFGSHQQTSPGPHLAGVADVAPGGDTPYVVALGAPGTASLEYAEDGRSYVPVELETRSAVFPRTGQDGTQVDTVRFQGEKGTQIVDVGSRSSTEPQPQPQPGDGPDNLASWPLVGDLDDGPDLDAAKRAFARSLGGSVRDLQFRPLLALSTDGGLRYVAGQAWLPGGRAHGVAYATGTECGEDVFIGATTPVDPKVLAFAPSCVPGRSTDTVFVVPGPGAGQVLYGAEGSEYRPYDMLPGLEPVTEIDRDPLESRGDDRIKVLDGDGNTDFTLFEGSLTALLCGIRECA